MQFRRLYLTVALNLQTSATKRGRWLKKHHIFAECGDNVRYQIRKIPICPELIKIGNNVNISTGASLMVHDAIHLIYNSLPDKKKKLNEYANPIEIGDNVFVGAHSIIMGGVKVGSNIIIAAGTVVTKDLEDGGIYGGIPAKRIGNIEDFWKKRETTYYPSIKSNRHVTKKEAKECWDYFYNLRKQK